MVVQSRQRADLHTSVRSTTTMDLVVRGDRFMRRARAFSSYGQDSILFEPPSTFQLVPGALNRIAVQCCPKFVGSRYEMKY